MSIEYLKISETQTLQRLCESASGYLFEEGDEASPQKFAQAFKTSYDKGALQLTKLLLQAAQGKVKEDPIGFQLFMQVVGFLISKKSPFREIKENEVQQVVDEVIAFLDKNVKEDSSSKIKILSYIFSALDTQSRPRLSIFNSLLKTCEENDQLFLLYPYLDKVDSILPWSSMSLCEKVGILNSVIRIVKEEEKPSLLLKEIKKLFVLFRGLKKEEILTHKDSIVSSLIDLFVEDELLFEMSDMMSQDHVKIALEGSQNIIDLYSGILKGDVSAASSLFDKAKDAFKGTSLDVEGLERKIRFTQMIKLADQHKQLEFAKISESLKCSEDEIELLYISAIEYGFMDAVIDQAKQMVYFGNVHQRNLESGSIDTLPSKIDEILKVFESFESA